MVGPCFIESFEYVETFDNSTYVIGDPKVSYPFVPFV